MIKYFKIFKVYFVLYIKYILIIFQKKKWIISRTACLGNDSIRLIHPKLNVINFQKDRIDNFVYKFENDKQNRLHFTMLPYIYRSDILELIFYQFITIKSLFNFSAPSALILDSYSELTDQKFISLNSKKNYFFINYNDTNKKILEKYNCEGLIEIENILPLYKNFFESFRSKFTSAPIIFIHFPKKLELRQKFIIRHDIIKNSINAISNQIQNLYIIDIPESIILENKQDPFPYHYNDEVYKYVSNKIKEILDV